MTDQEFVFFNTHTVFKASGNEGEGDMFKVSFIAHCTKPCRRCGATDKDMLVTDNSADEYEPLHLCLECLQKGLDEFKGKTDEVQRQLP